MQGHADFENHYPCETSDMGLYDTGASVSIVIVSGWFDMNSFIEVSV